MLDPDPVPDPAGSKAFVSGLDPDPARSTISGPGLDLDRAGSNNSASGVPLEEYEQDSRVYTTRFLAVIAPWVRKNFSRIEENTK